MFALQTFIFCVLLYSVVSFASTPRNPGIKVRLTQNGINYLIHSLVNGQIKNLTDVNFPDVNDVSNTRIGKLIYNITDIKILETSHKLFTVTLDEESNGLRLSIADGSISMGADWKYDLDTLKMSDRGYIKINIEQLNLNLRLKVESNGNDHMGLFLTECDASFNKFDLNFEGKHKRFYNLFKWLVTKYFMKPCELLKKVLEQRGQNISTKFRKPINRFTDLNFSFTQVPVIKKNFIDFNLRGEFFRTDDFEETPYRAQEIITDDAEDRMLTVWLTRYSVKTLLNSLFKNKKLHKRFVREDFVPNFHQHFETSCFSYTCIGFFFPTLRFLYPDSFLEIEIEATETPFFAIGTKGVSVTFNNTRAIFYARTTEGTEHSLFTFTLSFRMNFDLFLMNDYFHWKIVQHTFQMKLLKTYVGPIPDMLLSNAIDMIFSRLVIPELNKLGKNGRQIPLPVNMHMRNSGVAMDHGSIRLQTDIYFK